MDAFLLTEYILFIALILFSLAVLRIISHKSIAMALIGGSAFTIALATMILIMGNIYSIEWCRDISFILIFFGPVGTIAFAKTMGRK